MWRNLVSRMVRVHEARGFRIRHSDQLVASVILLATSFFSSTKLVFAHSAAHCLQAGPVALGFCLGRRFAAVFTRGKISVLTVSSMRSIMKDAKRSADDTPLFSVQIYIAIH